MLNFLRRRRPTPAQGPEALRIRNLLDDPRLHAVMGDVEPVTADTSMRRIDRERRAAADLFAGTRRERRAGSRTARREELAA